MVLDDTKIENYIQSLYTRANDFEKSLIELTIRSEGKLSLSEVYAMNFVQRELYIKCYNEYMNEKSNNKSHSRG